MFERSQEPRHLLLRRARGERIVERHLDIPSTIRVRPASWCIKTSCSSRGAVMADPKLGRLPDRTPVKLTIQILPDLEALIKDYAAAYEAAYGSRESVADLIPFMLASFLEADRGFHRSRQK